MSSQKLNRRLTTLDASFLYFEKKEAPMHIGSVHLFEGEVPFEDFVAMMDAKMHLVPRYQQIIKPDPFNLGHPTWEFDPHFDVRNHIFKLQLDQPGGEKELIELSGKIFTPVMDRDKPLWDIYWVYGLEGGNTAMIARIHHCMVDGMSGIDIIKIILDISPEIKPLPTKPETAQPLPPKFDPTRQFFDSLLGGMEEGMNRWMEFQNGLLNLAEAFTNQPAREAMQKVGGELPRLATPAPLLPFNRQCSGERKLAWSTFSFAEVRAIRTALGGTVNDVALTVLSSAVSKYVESHGQPVKNRHARFMVPVSLRQDEQRGALGNLVSLLPVEIPLDLRDVVERFRYINQKTGTLKGGRVAEGLNLFSALMGILPAPVQALAGALATAPFPAFNMVSTNVPGPQVPLYTMGKKMLAYYPYVPVGYAVGCGCAIVSYDQKIYFGLTADLQAMPDVERMRDFLNESYLELLQAAGVEEIRPQVVKDKKPPAVKTRSKSDGTKQTKSSHSSATSKS
ncbi:MAG TPA: wax ester/triacylglycerol synthase family O-acyltransferase [Pyrinomonadaceae bacterium]|jgi:WS/DGAT/MGAT family acyltransferase